MRRVARRRKVNFKTALLAVTAAAALIGAAIIGVPTTSDKWTEKPALSRQGR
jgi:hypothetical protein